jgi:hypothetical protein
MKKKYNQKDSLELEALVHCTPGTPLNSPLNTHTHQLPVELFLHLLISRYTDVFVHILIERNFVICKDLRGKSSVVPITYPIVTRHIINTNHKKRYA